MRDYGHYDGCLFAVYLCLWFACCIQCQGPFDTLQMLRWLEGGFFDPQRPLRRDDEAGFTPLADGKRLTEAAARIINTSRQPMVHVCATHSSLPQCTEASSSIQRTESVLGAFISVCFLIVLPSMLLQLFPASKWAASASLSS